MEKVHIGTLCRNSSTYPVAFPHEDGFFTYKGLGYANRKGIRSLLASSLIFVRTDYIRRYNLESLIDRKDFWNGPCTGIRRGFFTG